MREKIQSEVRGAGSSNDSLLKLSDSLANRLLDSKSDATSKKYWYSYRKFEEFLVSNHISEESVSSIHVALYITSLLDKGASYSVVSSAVYAIKWVNELKSLPNLCDNAYVNNLLESAKRSASKPVNKKDPVSAEMLIELCSKHEHSVDLLIIRNLSMILLGFSGFLRYNEIASLRCNDVIFHEDFFCLKIRKSKTDQYRLGNELVISKGHTAACPFNMLKKYFSLADIDNASDHILFKPVFRSKSTCKLIYKNKPLSYTSTKENIVKLLLSVNPNLNLGLHSLRSGGATAVANTDVKDRNWKRHGRWKSDNCKDGYVVDSLHSRLEVSKKLGL